MLRRSAFLLCAALCFGLVGTGAALAQQDQMQGQIFFRLHGDLHLAPAQEDSWKSFMQAYAMDPDTIARERRAEAAMPRLKAPQRVDQSIAMMQDDLESQKRRGAALKAFYGTLTPQQQDIFDRETLAPQMPGQ